MEKSVHDRCKDKEALSAAMNDLLRLDEDYVFVKDANLVYLASSEAFARMTGRRSAAEVAGKTDYDLFPRDIADKYRAYDRLVLDEGRSFEGIVERLPEEQGRERWTKTWKRPVRDGQGNVIGVYAIGRDITRVMDLEAEAQEESKREAAADLRKRKLILQTKLLNM